MKVFILLAALAVSTLGKPADENLEAAIAEPQKLQSLADCFLDRVPCSSAAAGFRKMTPDAVEHECGNCTPGQKHIANLFFANLRKHLPNEYDNFVKKYDPKGEHMDSFLKSIENF